MRHDYYRILEISRKANPHEIKESFRRLALKYHPDRNSDDPGAEDKFKEVAHAYQILSDPQQRKKYDLFGAQAVRGQGFEAMSLESIIKMVGHLLKNSLGLKRKPIAGKDLSFALDITFEEAGTGKTTHIEVPNYVDCTECGGNGTEDGQPQQICPSCDGKGKNQWKGILTLPIVCKACRGSGFVKVAVCKHCNGSTKKETSEIIQVAIPPGVTDGYKLRWTEKGHLSVNNGNQGDLYVQIKIVEHPLFDREDLDVVCTIPLTYSQVALGSTIEVPTLEGTVTMTIPPGTQSGRTFRLRSKGFPGLTGTEKGDQYVTVLVETPQHPGDEERRLLNKLAQLEVQSELPKRTAFLTFMNQRNQ